MPNNKITEDDELKNNPENTNEISIKIKIEPNDVGNIIYFVNNEKQTGYSFDNVKNKIVLNFIENLNEINEKNTTVIIDEKAEKEPFKKYLNPSKSGIYSIKLIFKNKLSNCAYMFYHCENIIEIDFSKFNTENVTDMQWMFGYCSGLKELNLEFFNTQNVTNMQAMFAYCSSLISLNLSSFNTQNVNQMIWMFKGCSSLKSLNLSSFNTKNVTDMHRMFIKCSSLTAVNLSSFDTQNVTCMAEMFYGCKSLTSLDLMSFNTQKVIDMRWIFDGCKNLKSCVSSNKNIVDEFNKVKNV